jgi:hypothetical protein
MMMDQAEKGDPEVPARRAGQGFLPPFCGHEYPPLKGSPGAVICTRPCHPETETHLNEETGWVWLTG